MHNTPPRNFALTGHVIPLDKFFKPECHRSRMHGPVSDALRSLRVNNIAMLVCTNSLHAVRVRQQAVLCAKTNLAIKVKATQVGNVVFLYRAEPREDELQTKFGKQRRLRPSPEMVPASEPTPF